MLENYPKADFFKLFILPHLLSYSTTQGLSQRPVQPSFGQPIIYFQPGRRKILPDPTKLHCGRTPDPLAQQFNWDSLLSFPG